MTTTPSPMSRAAATCAVAGAGISLLFLGALHALSPEFDPAWRMVSEYANGRYGWVLSLFFLMGGAADWALAIAIRPWMSGRSGKVALAFLVAAGLGGVMASVFDVNHDPGHSIAGLLGVGALPVAAMVVSVKLRRRPGWSKATPLLLLTANLTWIAVVLFILSFVVFFATYVAAGGDTSAPPKVLPAGVVGLVGWTDRLLVLTADAWVVTVAWTALRLGKNAERPATRPARANAL